MKKVLLTYLPLLCVVGVISLLFFNFKNSNQVSGAPPYLVDDSEPPIGTDENGIYANWVRPDGPPRVGQRE